MTLQEIINKFKPFGVSDMEIIKYYFQVNHCEEKAVDMLTNLSKEIIAQQRNYTSVLKTHVEYGEYIMHNTEIEEETRWYLLHLYNHFITNGFLYEGELEKIKGIFENLTPKTLEAFPTVFMGYLQSKGIGNQFHDCGYMRNPIIEKEEKE